MEVTISDHSPIFLVSKIEHSLVRLHRFRFENAWLTDPMCLELVKNNWTQNLDVSVMIKLEGCKEILDGWGRGLTGNFKNRINMCKSVLKRLKGKSDETSVRLYKEAQFKLNEVYHHKEIY